MNLSGKRSLTLLSRFNPYSVSKLFFNQFACQQFQNIELLNERTDAKLRVSFFSKLMYAFENYIKLVTDVVDENVDNVVSNITVVSLI